MHHVQDYRSTVRHSVSCVHTQGGRGYCGWDHAFTQFCTDVNKVLRVLTKLRQQPDFEKSFHFYIYGSRNR